MEAGDPDPFNRESWILITPLKSNIDTKKKTYLNPDSYIFQGIISWSH